jgi:hypothetical protein
VAILVKRANYLGAPEAYNLNNVALILNEAFGVHNYLVGSCLTTRDYRDVDIRCILEDAEFNRLFKGCGECYQYHSLWSLMCASISEWLSNRTGLKIDFQIQRQTQANAENDGPRQCLGLFLQSPGPGEAEGGER